MPVRPESYKIVMILFYLLLCTKYLFQQNFAKEKIFAIAVEIKVACIKHRKNIGFDKIAWKFRWRVMECTMRGGGRTLITPLCLRGL
jgi:hypothetical protein